MPLLGKEDAERYSRQTALPELGEEGQLRLLQSSALIVGAGGLGSPAAFYVAAAGVGRIGIADPDKVELSNLQRQILHGIHDLGRPKARSAYESLRKLNPSLKIEMHEMRVSSENAIALFSKYDFIIDATDSFAAKLMIAETAWQAGKPLSHGGVSGFCGQTMTVLPGVKPCLRCVFHETPADPSNPAGPMGFVPGVIGAIQAAEAVKFLAGLQVSLRGKMLTFNSLSMEFRKVEINPDPACPLCSKQP